MIRARCIAVVLLLAMTPLLAAEEPAAALLSRCAACHGAQGEGAAAVGAPPLAGQQADYLVRQLANFRNGTRGYVAADQYGASMRNSAATLSQAEQEQLATYYARLPAKPLPVAAAALDAKGRALYQQTCAACHGQQAQGYVQMHTPNLRLLGGVYIQRQLHNYVQGWRGTQPQTDIQGQWMRSIATHITDPVELAAVAGYIDSLGTAP